MVFDYYYQLSKREQAVYRASDRVQRVPVREPTQYRDMIRQLQTSLAKENQPAIQTRAHTLINRLAVELNAPALTVQVLSVRPSDGGGELHGLYEPVEQGRLACITVWMRTARNRQVVAYRTFFRTLLHELCHHLDYEVLKLADSFHTEGFFKRESSLFKQLHERR